MKVKLLNRGCYPCFNLDPCIGKVVEADSYPKKPTATAINIKFSELIKAGYDNVNNYNLNDTLFFMNYRRYNKEHKEFEVIEE